MALTFAGAGAWGAGKGALLTKAEFDDNTWTLKGMIEAVQAAIPVGVGIDTFTVTGTQLLVLLTDGSTRGPYTLPVATFKWRDAWTAATAYFAMDLFKVDGVGLFLVLLDHTSAATFDAAAVDGSANPLYKKLIAVAGVVNFPDLADVPPSYVGNSGKVPRVKGTEDGLEYFELPTVSSGSTDWKESVRAATTANITLSGEQTVGDVVLVAGNRVLVKDQTTAAENGIYDVALGAWTRSTDADSDAEVTSGIHVSVEEGVHSGKDFKLLTADPIVVGTTALTFVQVRVAASLSTLRRVTDVGYTLLLTDFNRWIRRDNAAANTTTVPPHSEVAFPNRSEIYIQQWGTGVSTIVAGVGVTIQSPFGLVLPERFSVARLKKISANVWTLDIGVHINALDEDASPNGAADYLMLWDASAGRHKKVLLDNALAGAAGQVTSFNGRTGAISPAQADYDGFFLTPAEADAVYAGLAHTHAPADITAGGASAGDVLFYDGTNWVPKGGINAQTGTSYTLVLADNLKLVTLDNAGAIAVTVPTNASVAFPVGRTTISLMRKGAGQVTIAGDVGVTVNKPSANSLTTRAQWSVVTLTKIDTDTWVLSGDMT